jgi:hypothetical protein
MAKKPEIEHEYHAGKDKLKITIQGYALTSKKARDNIVKNLIAEVERHPDRLIAGARKKSKKAACKQPDGQQKQSKLAEIGD